MGIDIKAGGRNKKTIRRVQTTKNVYIALLVKLYKFLARRTTSSFNKVVLKRLRMSRTNRPVMSLNLVSRFAKRLTPEGKDDRIIVVVGSITDDVRAKLPKMKVCALRVTDTARARIVAAGGEVLTFDQLALQRPTGAKTILLRGRRSARTANKYFGRPGTKGSTTRPKTTSKTKRTEVARGRRASRGFKV